MILACIHQTLWDAGDLTHIARSRLDYMQFRAPFIRLIIAITLTGCGSLHANPLIDQLIGTTTAYLEDRVALHLAASSQPARHEISVNRLDPRLRLPLRSEEHTSELQSRPHLVCRLLLEKKNKLLTH